MKPFDIELAKQGKPVCLRNGKKARIVCFDIKGVAYPIIALVEEDGHESTIYYNDRGRTGSYPCEYDLMMAPERKTGWINIYPYSGETGIAVTSQYVFKTYEEAKK